MPTVTHALHSLSRITITHKKYGRSALTLYPLLLRSQIAQTLCRSPKTIDGHREALMEKLDIHDRAELVRFAIREGLVEA